jgi:hypothetical protein
MHMYSLSHRTCGKGSITSDDLLATRRFKALTDEWTSEELGRFFWLVPEDMQEVRACRIIPQNPSRSGKFATFAVTFAVNTAYCSNYSKTKPPGNWLPKRCVWWRWGRVELLGTPVLAFLEPLHRLLDAFRLASLRHSLKMVRAVTRSFSRVMCGVSCQLSCQVLLSTRSILLTSSL